MTEILEGLSTSEPNTPTLGEPYRNQNFLSHFFGFSPSIGLPKGRGEEVKAQVEHYLVAIPSMESNEDCDQMRIAIKENLASLGLRRTSGQDMCEDLD